MERKTFMHNMAKLFGEEVDLYEQKAKDYSAEGNVFSHFESEAAKLNMTPQQILMVYLEKHLKAISRFCLTGEQDSQGIRERIKDARIYLALLEAMPRKIKAVTDTPSNAVKIDCTIQKYMPEKAHEADAGFDLRVTGTVTLTPGARCLAPTGVRMFTPEGYEVQIRPKSGLAVKYGVTVLNTPGTIDSGYTGEVMVPLINHGTETVTFNAGDKIAQAVVNKLPDVFFNVVSAVPNTERGDGGFGSTGA